MTGVWATVLVPDLPPEPPLAGGAGPVVIWSALVFVGFVITFTSFVVRSILGIVKSQRPFRLLVILVAGCFGSLGGVYIAHRAQTTGEDRAYDEYWRLEMAAQDAVRSELERTYGIAFVGSIPIFPMAERPWSSEEPVTLADGTRATCWIDIEGDHYVVLCGGDSPEASTRLEPVAR